MSERPQSMDELLRALSDACETASSRRARWSKRAVGGLLAVLAIASVFMAAMLLRAPEPTAVERGAPALEPASLAAPQPGVVAQNLALAVEAARAGHPDSALTHLELARKRALSDNDEIALLEVATQAEQLGDMFHLRGVVTLDDDDMLRTQTCWGIAMDIFVNLPDQATSAEHLRLKINRVRSK